MIVSIDSYIVATRREEKTFAVRCDHEGCEKRAPERGTSAAAAASAYAEGYQTVTYIDGPPRHRCPEHRTDNTASTDDGPRAA